MKSFSCILALVATAAPAFAALATTTVRWFLRFQPVDRDYAQLAHSTRIRRDMTTTKKVFCNLLGFECFSFLIGTNCLGACGCGGSSGAFSWQYGVSTGVYTAASAFLRHSPVWQCTLTFVLSQVARKYSSTPRADPGAVEAAESATRWVLCLSVLTVL